jgi:hypothetical protein
LARDCHANNRNASGITAQAVELARLYGYAFRGQVIGTFHATAVALETCEPPPHAASWRRRTIDGLASLAAQALDPICPDYRAVISTFHRYDTTIRQVLTAIDGELEQTRDSHIESIRQRFCSAVERITSSNGIIAVRDDEVPQQATFVVPGLGITIVPLIYGDLHSWNLAFLTGKAADVPCHLHRHGVEIHLGYGNLQGWTVLGRCRAEVNEGYAMAISPRTPHGFYNTTGHDHCLPFIFGSLRLGGWGIVLDVEPQPVSLENLEPVPASDARMNGMAYLDREIERAAGLSSNARWIIVDSAKTYRLESGALELSIARVTTAGLEYPRESFRIMAVARGQGLVRVGSVECEVAAHDHFGIPSGMDAVLQQRGEQPLVVLDAILIDCPKNDEITDGERSLSP